MAASEQQPQLSDPQKEERALDVASARLEVERP